MEQAPWIISIASPVVACVVFYLKSNIKSSNTVTSTLLNAYVKNLDKNSEMVSRLTENLEKSTKSLDNIESNQEDLKNNQVKIMKSQNELINQNKGILRKFEKR